MKHDLIINLEDPPSFGGVNRQSSIVRYLSWHLYTCKESSTNQLLFMQNKPNVKDAQINVNSYMNSKYEKLDTWLSGKNKPNSNPIKPNFKKAKMNVNLYVIEDYRKKDDFVVRINKPNFRNGQNERKLNFNKGLQKKRLFSSPKNKAKQSQFLQRPKSLAGKSGHTRFWGVLYGFVLTGLKIRVK